MNYIYVLLPDFRRFVSSKKFKSAENVHSVFYWEDEIEIRFYKPVGSIIYITSLLTDKESLKLLPVDIDIRSLIQEFDALQIPHKIDAPSIFSGTISK